jgi:hypothetical protein
MARDRMQKQRFELKYWITEETALLVRDFVRSYLDLDEYSVGRPNYSYPVHSVYLDSDDLKTYWWTINGNRNRFKLRMRFYSANPSAPAFFELKRRVNSCILKQRGAVRQDAIPLLMAGHFPAPEHLVSQNPNHLSAVQRFCHLREILQAKPKVHIGYLREAYLNDHDTVRVTMDREVCAEPNLSNSVKTTMENPVKSFERNVILELKFTNRFPDWFGDLVRTFHVMQCGAAKYVESIQGIGSKPLGSPFPVIEEPIHYSRAGE